MAVDRLVFDVNTTDDDRSNVGAFLRSSDGTLLTHTTVGGKEALDVRIAEGINVEVDLDAADDSVESWTNDGAGNAITSTSENGDQALDVHISNTSIAVTATDLDIRDLTSASDSVEVLQDTHDDLNANANIQVANTDVSNGNPVPVSDAGGSITVDATQLDIDDLNATDDAVQAWAHDGSGNAISSTSNALDVYVTGSDPITVNDAALADTTMVATTNPLGADDTAEDVVASPLTSRKYLWLYNNGNKKVFIGGNGVTQAAGFPLSPGSYLALRAGPSVDIEWIAENASGSDLRTLELS